MLYWFSQNIVKVISFFTLINEKFIPSGKDEQGIFVDAHLNVLLDEFPYLLYHLNAIHARHLQINKNQFIMAPTVTADSFSEFFNPIDTVKSSFRLGDCHIVFASHLFNH